MTWLDNIPGQRLKIADVEQSPRSRIWNFVSGVSAAYNTSTHAWDLTVSGGGGSGHTIEDEGVALTARTSLNFVGVNVTVTDAGGKTVVTIGAVSLAGSQVTGTLPIARGGTGLGALGTALQSIRVNAGATALEFYTPAAGMATPGGDGHLFTFSVTTADADPGAGTIRFNNVTPASITQIFVDDADASATDITAWLASLDDNVGTIKGRITVRSITDPTKKLVFNLTAWTTAVGYKKLTVTHIFGASLPTTTAGDTFLSFDSGPVGGVTNTEISASAAIALTKLADGSACSVVTRAANSSGAHADQAIGTNGFVLLRRSNALTGALLLDENIDTAAAILRSKIHGAATQGTNLTDANQTIVVTDGTEFTMAATTTTSARNKTLGTTGSPKTGERLVFYIFAQGHNVVFLNGGPLAGTLCTVTAGEKLILVFEWNGADWMPPGIGRMP